LPAEGAGGAVWRFVLARDILYVPACTSCAA
jgi:hypothetical protein